MASGGEGGAVGEEVLVGGPLLSVGFSAIAAEVWVPQLQGVIATLGAGGCSMEDSQPAGWPETELWWVLPLLHNLLFPFETGPSSSLSRSRVLWKGGCVLALMLSSDPRVQSPGCLQVKPVSVLTFLSMPHAPCQPRSRQGRLEV